MADFLGATTVKSCRKKHNCYWCPELINIGESAHRDVWTEDGSAETIYWHLECFDVAGSYDGDPHWEDFEPHSEKRGVRYEEHHANLMGLTTV